MISANAAMTGLCDCPLVVLSALIAVSAVYIASELAKTVLNRIGVIGFFRLKLPGVHQPEQFNQEIV